MDPDPISVDASPCDALDSHSCLVLFQKATRGPRPKSPGSGDDLRILRFFDLARGSGNQRVVPCPRPQLGVRDVESRAWSRAAIRSRYEKTPPLWKERGLECPEEDSNLHGILLPPAPQAGASANSATWAMAPWVNTGDREVYISSGRCRAELEDALGWSP